LKTELEGLLASDDTEAWKERAKGRPFRVLRFLVGRLSSHDDSEKRRAVAALGAIVADRALVDDAQVLELVRRFLWAMSDESGAVPFGIPEALGEVLAHRDELQKTYVPILGSYLTSEELHQTGPIERSVMWGLGRVGRPVNELAEEAVRALETAASFHPDDATREEARQALGRIRRMDA
jgi:hypothetical protein